MKNQMDNSIDTKIVKFGKREAEILKALRDGLRNREIAKRLDINQKTVSTYIGRAKEKLGLSKKDNTYKLVVYALPSLEINHK